MYYDDQARRFNFVSGLLVGSVVGAGLALLAFPQVRVRKSAARGRARTVLQNLAPRRIRRRRGGVVDTLSEAVERGRHFLRR